MSGLGSGLGGEVDQLMLLRGKRDMMASSSSSCADNCSGNGICVNGSCHCQVGSESHVRRKGWVSVWDSRNLPIENV